MTLAEIRKNLAIFSTPRVLRPPALKTGPVTNGAKAAERTSKTTTPLLEDKRTSQPKTASMTRKQASVDTSDGNLFWDMLPFSKLQKGAKELAQLAQEAPHNFGELPNWANIIEDLRQRAMVCLLNNDQRGFDNLFAQILDAQKRHREDQEPRPPAPSPKPAPKPASKSPTSITEIQELRVYWHLKSGKRATAKVTLLGPIRWDDALEGIQKYMAGQTLAKMLNGVYGAGASFAFGYWADEQTFRNNDYSIFFPTEYPGIFKVASCKLVPQYGGSYYYEVRLQEV